MGGIKLWPGWAHTYTNKDTGYKMPFGSTDANQAVGYVLSKPFEYLTDANQAVGYVLSKPFRISIGESLLHMLLSQGTPTVRAGVA
jgi:uncharacterized protein (UPF0297 family)